MENLPQNSIVISLEEVAHRFGKRTVFTQVSATVQTGEILIVTGANGAGKSTLLRIVAGLLTPTSGRVKVQVGVQELDNVARRRLLGYVAPDLTLYRELTGAENLEFFAGMRGLKLTREDLIARLTEVGLRGRGRDHVGTYSSGMRQRLKYAFALLFRPPILLLDEPTANLDSEGVAMVERVIAAQRERPGGGVTIVATNEPREAAWGQSHIALTTESPSR